jgi:hypothetical protein
MLNEKAAARIAGRNGPRRKAFMPSISKPTVALPRTAGHRWLRGLVAWLFGLHGLAHALPVFLVTGPTALNGDWAGALARIVTGVLATLATAGFLAAGFGVIGLKPLSRIWVRLVYIAAAASVVLAALSPGRFWLIGLALDALAVVLARIMTRGAPGWAADEVAERRGAIRVFATAGHLFAWGFLLWIGAAAVLRPWQIRWGATSDEVRLGLPGDPSPRALLAEINHAVAIHAEPDQVWPWLAQIGQDRGGFYSLDWLENLFGLRLRNADRIHPEWQDLEARGFVRAAPPDYAGGAFGDHVGWNVLELDANRHIVLEGWGAFVLLPSDNGTRLLIRTHTGRPNVVAAPLMVLGFEPIHFIMERAMLHGIRSRAENQAGKGG